MSAPAALAAHPSEPATATAPMSPQRLARITGAM